MGSGGRVGPRLSPPTVPGRRAAARRAIRRTRKARRSPAMSVLTHISAKHATGSKKRCRVLIHGSGGATLVPWSTRDAAPGRRGVLCGCCARPWEHRASSSSPPAPRARDRRSARSLPRRAARRQSPPAGRRRSRPRTRRTQPGVSRSSPTRHPPKSGSTVTSRASRPSSGRTSRWGGTGSSSAKRDTTRARAGCNSRATRCSTRPSLTEIIGFLQVTATPADALVTVDGQEIAVGDPAGEGRERTRSPCGPSGTRPTRRRCRSTRKR